MFNRHFLKTLFGFLGIITAGLVGFYVLDNYDRIQERAKAKVELPNR